LDMFVSIACLTACGSVGVYLCVCRGEGCVCARERRREGEKAREKARESWSICLFAWLDWCYGVATLSKFLKTVGLICKRALWKRRYSAKETCNFKEPSNRSHPIFMCDIVWTYIYKKV